jgi:hypothetical protein
VDRRRVQDALDRSAADLALLERIVVDRLHHLEGVTLATAVFIDRHRVDQYRWGHGATGRLLAARFA